MFFKPTVVVALLSVGATVAATGCQSAPEALPLNSERIEAAFGSYGVEVIRQEADLRHACLYSEDAGGRTCRTLAIVAFNDRPEPDLAGPLEDIRNGASLGATLAAAGWRVDKVNRYIGHVDLDRSSAPSVLGLLSLDGAAQLALHIYELRARRGNDDLTVAEILELHHPEYLRESDLRRIYGGLPAVWMTADDRDTWLRRLRNFPPGQRFD
jgi:hypothetical protein